MPWPIVTMPIDGESDVVAVRQRARRIGELLGLERQDQTRIATAVSEIARNAVAYAGGGRAEFILEEKEKPQLFRIRISDKGKGISDLQSILDGQYRSPTGMGIGLVGARRLMDRFKIESNSKGTIVDLGKELPTKITRVTQAKLSEIVADIKKHDAADPLAALREQNRELIFSLEEIRRKDEESAHLNQELGDTNRGVVALYAELDERAEQLHRASELKTRFLSNMSHEFRTPLNSILALSRLLLDRLDGDLTPEQERQIGYVRRSAETLLEMVNDLLDLAKVEAGKVETKVAAFTVSSLFGALRGALKPLLTTGRVDLFFDIPQEMPELYTDESKVAQILRNLISNALKFTEKGEVRVRAQYEPHEKLAIFSVRDTGIGIAPQDLSRVFEEFSQVDTKLHKKAKGTGLGLPLSRSLAELIGGVIRVESVVGQGSVFSLVIPAKFTSNAATPAPTVLSKKRILIIDDDDTFRYILRQIINSEPQYEVLEASDGSVGLNLARDDPPDLIVLDLQMPNVDGFTVMQELTADGRTSVIPVIVSTSLEVNAELKARLPVGTRLISKNLISRENVSMFLRDAFSAQALL